MFKEQKEGPRAWSQVPKAGLEREAGRCLPLGAGVWWEGAAPQPWVQNVNVHSPSSAENRWAPGGGGEPCAEAEALGQRGLFPFSVFFSVLAMFVLQMMMGRKQKGKNTGREIWAPGPCARCCCVS